MEGGATPSVSRVCAGRRRNALCAHKVPSAGGNAPGGRQVPLAADGKQNHAIDGKQKWPANGPFLLRQQLHHWPENRKRLRRSAGSSAISGAQPGKPADQPCHRPGLTPLGAPHAGRTAGYRISGGGCCRRRRGPGRQRFRPDLPRCAAAGCIWRYGRCGTWSRS